MANIKPMKLNPTSKLVVSLSSVIIVGIAAYNWAVSPQTSYLRAAHLYDVMIGDAGNMTNVIKSQMGPKNEEVKILQEEIGRIQDKFFTPKQASEFFLDLEPIALQYNCTIDKLAFVSSEPVSYDGTESESEDIIAKKLSISYTGDYKDIITFLKRLESYTQRIVITDVHIESDEMVGDELFCQMIITIYMVEDKELKSDE